MNTPHYQELYKKYRPENFSDIVGQDIVVSSLKNDIRNSSVPTAYGFFGSHGCGKALHKDTVIPTPNGFKTMGELNVGDIIYGSTSQLVEVTNKYCPYDKDSFLITFRDSTQVKTSSGHLWEILKEDTKTLEKTSHILSTGEMFDLMKNFNHKLFINNRQTHVDNYTDFTALFESLGFTDYMKAYEYIVDMAHTMEEYVHYINSRLFVFNAARVDSVKLEKFVSVLRLLGGVVNVDGYIVSWYNFPQELEDSLSLLIKPTHKALRVNKEHTAYCNYIVDIAYIEDNPEDYFCISVDSDDELFLCTENFLVTHNTSSARIVSKALNCENPSDDNEPCNMCESCLSIEDGSNLDITYRSMANKGSADDIRELCKTAFLQPQGKKSVFILDEVHNLSKAAFDSLLIPLEDESMQSLFILCSTEPQKIPNTVLSRIQTKNFSPVDNMTMLNLVTSIAEKEEISITEEDLKKIVRKGRGSVRDTLALVEKYISEGEVSQYGKTESDYAKKIIQELCTNKNDSDCLVKVFTVLNEAEKVCDLEEIVKNVFTVSKSFIIKLNTENKDTIARRKNAFEFFQDLMMLSGQSLATMRLVDNADIRTHVDMIAVSIVKMHPMETVDTEEVWG